jgi:DNA-binding Lrp family transcriptional regulator
MPKLLAFVDIFVESPEMDNVVDALVKLENLEELYEVTGEFDIVSLVSAEDIEEFRDILKNKILKIKGVKSTVTSIVLRAHKGPKCEAEQEAAGIPPEMQPAQLVE